MEHFMRLALNGKNVDTVLFFGLTTPLGLHQIREGAKSAGQLINP